MNDKKSLSKAKNAKHGEWHLNTSWHNDDDVTYERVEATDKSEDITDSD
jgi:hypothetical protein